MATTGRAGAALAIQGYASLWGVADLNGDVTARGVFADSLTLTCASRFRGLEEARAVAAAVRARLADAPLEADGVKAVSVAVTFTDLFRSADLKRAWAVMRLRAVTEEI
jgi:hypothetical protein